jgi:hypothetical protein
MHISCNAANAALACLPAKVPYNKKCSVYQYNPPLLGQLATLHLSEHSFNSPASATPKSTPVTLHEFNHHQPLLLIRVSPTDTALTGVTYSSVVAPRVMEDAVFALAEPTAASREWRACSTDFAAFPAVALDGEVWMELWRRMVC